MSICRSLLAVGLVILATTCVIGDSQASKPEARTDDCTDCIGGYFTLKTSADGKVELKSGVPIVVKTTRPESKVPVMVHNFQQGTPVTINAQCTTSRQDGQTRRACDQDPPTVFTEPDGYYFSIQSLSIAELDVHGSEHECHVDWSDYVDIAPGVSMPRTIRAVAHARSDGFGTRGVAKYSVTASYYRMP
jgi:hypothetical protein